MGLFIMLDPETTVALKVGYQTSADDFVREDLRLDTILGACASDAPVKQFFLALC